jgi:hypothetical protein
VSDAVELVLLMYGVNEAATVGSNSVVPDKEKYRVAWCKFDENELVLFVLWFVVVTRWKIRSSKSGM